MTATATDITGVDAITPVDTNTATAAAPLAAPFDSAARWERSAKVGLRPEPFGALAYHFDTRRLVFLKSPKLVALVEALAEHKSAAEAVESIIAPPDERSRRMHLTALASLAEAGVIVPAASPIAFVG